MKKLGVRLLLVSFVFALIAAITLLLYLRSLDHHKETKVEVMKVFVAAQTIAPRTLIDNDMIQEIEIPVTAAYGEFIHAREDIVGKYSKGIIVKDDLFHKEALLEEVEEELSLKIAGNQRAISIFVNGASGVADMIKVGDFTDIIVTLPEIKEAERIVRPNLSKIILQNIEVLAIDKKQYRDEEDRQEIPTNWLLTLSVSTNELEKLVLAQDIGDIKFALRPFGEHTIIQTEGTIWQELLLDDFYKMKDLSPQYEMKELPQNQVSNAEEYTYKKYYYYTIQYGDTLRKISEKFYGTPDQYTLIKQVNRIEDENEIIAGTGIKIPDLEEKKGENE